MLVGVTLPGDPQAKASVYLVNSLDLEKISKSQLTFSARTQVQSTHDKSCPLLCLPEIPLTSRSNTLTHHAKPNTIQDISLCPTRYDCCRISDPPQLLPGCTGTANQRLHHRPTLGQTDTQRHRRTYTLKKTLTPEHKSKEIHLHGT